MTNILDVDRPYFEQDPVVRQFGYCERVVRTGIWLMRNGYGRMMLLPYMSPSGCYWRCTFHPIDDINREFYRYTSGNGHQYLENHNGKRTRSNIAISKLANAILEIIPKPLMESCQGDLSQEIDEWLQQLERALSQGYIPVAFADWETDPKTWMLSHPTGSGSYMLPPPGYMPPSY